MTFARPEWLWLLAVVPMLAAWVARGRKLRARAWSALAKRGRPAGVGLTGWLGAVVCLVIALAGPRWGRSAGAPLPPGHDVVLLVDVSRSMAAEDAVPNRLGVAVEAAEGLATALGRSQGDRAAVVAFAGRGVMRCPLTENLGAVAEVLKRLRPGAVRPGGTDLRAALDAALEAFDDQERAEGRAIVLFSDGEDLAGQWAEAVDPLRSAGVVVHAVAIGDAEHGHPVPSGRDATPLTYHGVPVLSQRRDEPLDALATATGGVVVRLGLASADLGTLYLHQIAPATQQRREARRAPDRPERYAVFVLAALGLGLAGSWPGWRLGTRALLFLGIAVALGAGPDDRALVVGREAFAAGQFDAALAEFEAAHRRDPRSAVASYNAAATLFQLGRFNAAQVRYLEAREHADVGLRMKIDYGLGNTALALGDLAGAIKHYKECLASKAAGSTSDAVRSDAATNLQFAEEQMRKPAPKPSTPENRPGPGPSDKGRTPDNSPPGSGGESPRPSPSTRGPGGAGGTGAAPPGAGTPQERLDDALNDIRAAQRRRLADEPPAKNRDEDRKDW